MMESLLEMRPSALAFSSSFCVKAEGTQLVAAFVVFPLAILFFAAKCFTRIYDLRSGAMQENSRMQRLQQWWRRRRHGAGKKYKSSLSPNIPSQVEERGLRRGANRGNGSPLTGGENTKLPRCPRNGSRSVKVTYREIWPLTS
jgi:hypothetical protein